jgi:glycosyltransferase involved in cell wall biosynthesis
LAEFIEDGTYEVVHANTLQSFWAIEAARLAKVPSVWSVHESEPWQTYFDGLPTENAVAALSCLRYPYRVLFTAQSSARVWSDLNSSGNFGLIRFAFDTRLFRSELGTIDRDHARRELNLNVDDLCVLLLGTVCERKGQHDLVRAFAALPGSIAARMKCIVVGARDSLAYSRKLQYLAERLPEDRRQRFLVIPETGATAVYWLAADLFCCTSRVESYPRVTLEAMAAGLPIISTPVFGLAEQVRHAVNGLIYYPGDIKTLTRHLTLLTQDQTKRRDLAEGSTWTLQSLPDHARMDQQYQRTFQAAAESAVAGEIERRKVLVDREDQAHGRVRYADGSHESISSSTNRPLGVDSEQSFLHNR